MRFLRHFKFSHKRTESDPTDAYSRVRDSALLEPISGLVTEPLSTTPLRYADASVSGTTNTRIFDLETENSRIRDTLTTSLAELAEAQAQLRSCQETLHTQLQKSSLQRKDREKQLEELRERLLLWETFLELVIIANPNGVLFADAYADLSEGHTVEHAVSTAIDNAIQITPVANTFGTSSGNNYASALQLTLKSRRQLKQYRKIAKFWRGVAKDSERNTNLVTPSVSSISSILEVLPAERQKAVDELIARRKKFTQATTTHAPLDDLEAVMVPELITTSKTAQYSEPAPVYKRLPPLASISLRQEVDSFASLYSFSKLSHVCTTLSWQKSVDYDSEGMSSNSCYQVDDLTTAPKINPMIAYTQRLKGQRRAKGYAVRSRSDSFAPNYMGPSIFDRARDVPNATAHCDNYKANELAVMPNDTTKTGTDRKPLERLIPDLNTEKVHRITPTVPGLQRKVNEAKSKLPMPVFPSLVRKLSVTEHRVKVLRQRGRVVSPGILKTSEGRATRLPVRIKD